MSRKTLVPFLDRLARLIVIAALLLGAATAGRAPALAATPPAPAPTPAPVASAPDTASATADVRVFLPLILDHAATDSAPPAPLPDGFAALIPAGAQIVFAQPAADGGERATVDGAASAALFLDQRVMVVTPAGAFAGAATLTLRPSPALAEDGPLSAPLRFSLEARRAGDGALIETFAQPVQLVADLRPAGLGGDWFLAYQDPSDPAAWHRPEITVHDGDGLISVQTDHFSTWAAGAEPAAWKFKPQLPTVSAFSGAATYHYAVPVPAGRAGLTPNVDLSYSSRGVDALTLSTEQDQGPLGLGWSFAGSAITRRGVHVYCCWDSGPVLVYPDAFSLSLNGASHDLFPEPGVDTATAAAVRYYAQNAPGLFVQRVYDPAAPNADKVYWIVRTPDGTTYRFGYTPDAEVTQAAGTFALAGHGGASGVTPLRWQLDLTTDTFGNQIQYTYENWLKRDGGLTTEGARPAEVRYNFATPAPGPLTATDSDYLSRIVFVGGDNHRVTRLEVYNVDLARPVRVVEIGLSGVTYSGVANCGSSSTTTTVTAIQEIGADGVARLPAATFTYTPLAHHGGCYPYLYLREVDNGYGGRVRFTYAEDGRQEDVHGQNRPPAFGRSYFVTQVETWDGLAAQPAVTRYEYSEPCYDADGQLGALPGASTCRLQDPVSVPGAAPYQESGGLVGFRTATVTVLDESGIGGLSRSVTTFSQDRLTLGRALRAQTWDWADGAWALLRETASAYDEVAIAGSGARHARLRSVETTTSDGGEPVTTRQEYARYDLYGNLEETIDYGADGAPYRRKVSEYAYNVAAGRWLTAAVIREQVFARDGDGWAATPAAETRYDYDGDDDPRTAAPGAHSRATATRRWDLDPATGAARFVDTRTDYDAWGRPQTVTSYGGYGTEAAYASSDPRTTRTDYGPAGFDLYPTRVVNPLSHAVEFLYDPRLGLPATITDVNRVPTHYRYDAFGRLTAVVRAGDSAALPTVRYVYHDGGAPAWVETVRREASGCAACEHITLEFYDGLGRTVQVRAEAADGRQTVTNVVYDALGRAVCDYLPVFEPWSASFMRPDGWAARPRTYSEYDALGRTIRVIGPDGATVQSAYRGLQTAVLDANGGQLVREADAFGRLAAVYEYDATGLTAPDFERAPYAVTRYGYDVLDDLVRIETVSATTTLTYNALGQKIALDDPDLGAWTYRYDAAGNLISQTDARGVTTSFVYDQLDRLTARSFSVPAGSGIADPGLAQFFYDEGGADAHALGRRTRMMDATGVTRWTYDERGRLIAETREMAAPLGAFTFQYAYNAADQRVQIVYPDGEVVTTALDAAGQPESLASSLGGPYVSAAGYDALARLTRLALGNGLETAYDFYAPTMPHQGGRLRQLRVGDSLLDFTYAYDANGNLTRLEDRSALMAGVQTQQFEYDPLDRLIRAEAAGGALGAYAHAYHYDPSGRFLEQVEAGQTLAYRYDDPAHPHAATALGDGARYTYDAAGNMLTRLEAGVTYTQTWTADNRLARVVWVNTGRTYTTTFAYDGDGARTLKIEDDGEAEITTFYFAGLYERQLDTTRDDMSEVLFRSGAAGGKPGLIRMATRDYSGPGNRTVNVWVPPTYAWQPAQVSAQPWVPSCNNKPANPVEGNECGYGTGLGYDAASCSALGQWPCQDGERYNSVAGYYTPVTYPPATASASVTCTAGASGWCTSAATLTLSGAEPMPGETITGLSYSFSGSGVASSTENVNPRALVVGETMPRTYYYWAESSFGDQSAMQSIVVKVDVQPPAIQLGGPAADQWYTGNPVITVQATDGVSGPRCLRAQWDSWPADDPGCSTTSTSLSHPGEGARTLFIRAWDHAGHQTTSQAVYKRDATAPSMPAAATTPCAVSGVWQNACGAPTFTWPASTDAVSGVAGYEYYWGTSATGTSANTTASASYAAGSANSGITYLRLRARDQAGNTSAWTTAFVFQYDTAAPATGVALAGQNGDDGWFRSPVTVTLSASDDYAGVAATQYRLDGGAWNDYVAPFTLAADGIGLVEYRSGDAAGNWASPASVQVRLDMAAPVLDSASATEDSAQGVQDSVWQGRVARPRFSWGGVDDAPAGLVTGYRVYWGADPEGSAPFTETDIAGFTAPADAGPDSVTYLRLQARDAAGNWSGWKTLFTFQFDNTPPALQTFTPDDGAVLTTARPTFSATYTDAGSGLAEPVLVLDQQIVTPTVGVDAFTYAPAAPLAPGLHSLTLHLTDQAGNATIARRVFWIDAETFVHLITPADEASLNQLETPVVIAGEPGATATLTAGGETYTHTFDTSGRWQIESVALHTGLNSLTVSVEDAAGNTATDHAAVTVDLSQDVAQASAEQFSFNPEHGPALFYVTALPGDGREVLAWSLEVRDAGGRAVAAIAGGAPAERQPVLWDGLDLDGHSAPDGTYTYRLTLTTTGGLQTHSTVGEIALVRAAPAAPTLVCGPDGETWFTQPPALARGTAPDGLQVVIYQDDVPQFVAPVFGLQWQQPISLTQGAPFSVTVTARTLDAAGNLSAPSAPCRLGLTQSDPFVAPHAALSQVVIGRDDAVQITATTRAIGAPLTAEGVRVSLPPGFGPAPLMHPTGSYGDAHTWNGEWLSPASGAWEAPLTIVFNATDTAQPAPNHGVQFVQPYLDLVPPPAHLHWPWDGYGQSSPTLAPQGAAEPFSTVTISSVRVADSAVFTATTQTAASGLWQATLSLPDGVYRLSAQAADRAGNLGPKTDTITLTVDTTGPTLLNFAPEAGYVRLGGALTFSAGLSDPLSGVAAVHARVDDLQQAGEAVTVTLQPAGADIFAGTLAVAHDADEGLKAVTVEARDGLGNTRTFTDAVVIVDHTPPILSEIELTANDPLLVVSGTTTYYGPETVGGITLSVTASDEAATHTTAGLATLIFPAIAGAEAETVELGGVRAASAYTHTVALNGVDEGVFSLQAIDRAGNVAASTFTLVYDTTPPTVTVSAPAASGLKVVVRWAGADFGAGLEHFDVEYRDQAAAEWTSWLAATTETSGTFQGQDGRVYVVRARATDRVGNVSAWQEVAVTVTAVTKYYTFGGQRLAMRQGAAVYYLHGDHLGSASLVTDAAGHIVGQTRYLPYGQERVAVGAAPTDFGFTGQRRDGFGLLDYNARFYSPALGQFISPDTLIPDSQDPQQLNRYAYVRGNPLRYTDPTGHCFEGVSTLVCIAAAGALIGVALDFGAQIYHHSQLNGGDVGRAVQAVDWGEVAQAGVAGAALAFGAAVMAPVALTLAGDVLAGAGLATGSTALFSAGMSAYQTAGAATAFVYGTAAASRAANNLTSSVAGPRPTMQPPAFEQTSLRTYEGRVTIINVRQGPSIVVAEGDEIWMGQSEKIIVQIVKQDTHVMHIHNAFSTTNQNIGVAITGHEVTIGGNVVGRDYVQTNTGR